MIKTAKQALATHWEMDFADVDHYRYKGRIMDKPVYSIDNFYYCATKGKPAKEIGSNITDQYQWAEVADPFVNKFGWKIFKAPSE